MIGAEVVPHLVETLKSSTNDGVVEQALMLLGNIAADCVEFRDYLLDRDVLLCLLKILSSSKLAVLRIGVWALSNLCRGVPQPKFDPELVLPLLANLIYKADEEVLVDSLWSLVHLIGKSEERIKAAVKSGLVRRVVELLLHSSYPVKAPAVQIVRRITGGEESIKQVGCHNLIC